MIILIHSSKTMRPPAPAMELNSSQKPELIEMAEELDRFLKTLSVDQLEKIMKISNKLAIKTKNLVANWNSFHNQRIAIDSFLGDIYSGLQVKSWSKADLDYANRHLRILSGLYGILRPLDGIYPYRLEMGYRVAFDQFSNLYNFWTNKIAKTLPENELIINLAAKEYSQVVTNYIDNRKIISPIFLTKDTLSKKFKFVAVHSKITRGAYANWLIKNRIDKADQLRNFKDLNYEYKESLSSEKTPTFVCESFGGLGLSVRLK
jgi:cytoplasmic iron level regulating protein YaaA (DUF328/UPF0246 family)